MPIWDSIGRELRNLWEILTTGEAQTDDEIPEETDDEPGGFFGGEEPPEEPSGSAGFDDDDGGDFDPDDFYVYHAGEGPYHPNWGDNEAAFWDTVADRHIFESYDKYEEAMEAFDTGWIDQSVDTDERTEAREYYTEVMYMDMDWTAWQEYYSEL